MSAPNSVSNRANYNLPVKSLVNPAIIYSGLPNNLDISPFTGDLAIVSNVNDIFQSVTNILLTFDTERPYSQVGSSVQIRPFELATDIEFVLLKSAIVSALNIWEPRIQVQNVSLTSSQNNSYIASIIFTLLAAPGVPVTVSVIISRNR